MNTEASLAVQQCPHPDCGALVTAGKKFCKYCGRPLQTTACHPMQPSVQVSATRETAPSLPTQSPLPTAPSAAAPNQRPQEAFSQPGNGQASAAHFDHAPRQATGGTAPLVGSPTYAYFNVNGTLYFGDASYSVFPADPATRFSRCLESPAALGNASAILPNS